MTYKTAIFFLISIFFQFVYLQNVQEIKILPRENHYSNVVSSVASIKNNQLISSDDEGNIIIRSLTSFKNSYKLKIGKGFPVNNLVLAKNDSLLIYTELDTLYGMYTHNQKNIIKLQGNYVVSDLNNKLYFIKHDISKKETKIEILTKDFKEISSYTYQAPVKQVQIADDLSHILLLEKDDYLYEKLIYIELESKKILKTFEMPFGKRADKIYYNALTKTFEVIAYDTELKKLLLYNLSDLFDNKKPLLSTDYPFNFMADITINSYNEGYFIGYFSPLGSNFAKIINRNKKISVFDTKNYTTSLVFSEGNFITFDKIWFGSIEPKKVDLNKIDLNEIPNQLNYEPPFYAYFLPNNAVLVTKFRASDFDFFKYYEPGTLYDRFFKLSFFDYLKLNHQVQNYFTSFLDTKSGDIVLKAKLKNKEGFHFYKYSFINDELSEIDHAPSENFDLLSSDLANNQMLFSDAKSLIYLENGVSKQIEGQYEQAIFSKTGQYLMLLKEDKQLSILNLKTLKTIHTEVLPRSDVYLQCVSDDLFLINYNNLSKWVDNCNKKFALYNIQNDKITQQESNCINLTAFEISEQISAMVFNQNILKINQKDYSHLLSGHKIINLSINKDKTKMLLTMHNGMVNIINLTTMKSEGVMMHPDNKTHVFAKDNKYYFSNTNIQDYFNIFENNTPSTWDKLPQDYQNPLEILSMFGTPNQEYAEALKKAISIKGNVNEVFNNNTTISEVKESLSNLHLLAIGVSEYKQSDFNLTYADKDAMDMAKTFGILNENQKSYYYNTFFGKKINLNSQDKTKKILSIYYERYANTGEFFPISSKAYQWVEFKNNVISLYNFEKELIKNMSFEYSMPLTNGPQFGISSDQSTFYFLNNNEIILYDLNKDKYTIIKLHQKINQYLDFLLSDKMWLTTDLKDQKLNLNFVNHQNQVIKKRVVIDLMKIPFKLSSDENHPCEYSCLPEVKAATPDGNIVLIKFYYPNVYFVLNTNTNTFFQIEIDENEIEQLKNFYFSSNNQFIICSYEADQNVKHEVFGLNGKKIKNFQLSKPSYSIQQVDFLDDEFTYIKIEEPLLEENILYSENEKLFTTQKAHSFQNVYTSFLINQNATKKEIEKAFAAFQKNIKPEDQVLVFLAGHGVLDQKNNYYFAPHDMDFKQIGDQGNSYDFILKQLQAMPSNHKLLLMDTCHSGNVYDDLNGSQLEGQRGAISRKTSASKSFKVADIVKTLYANTASNKNLTIISASSGSDVAFEYKALGNGAFTHAFIGELKKRLQKGSFSFGELDWNKSVFLNQSFIDEVFKEVITITNSKQTPDIREIAPNSQLKVW